MGAYWVQRHAAIFRFCVSKMNFLKGNSRKIAHGKELRTSQRRRTKPFPIYKNALVKRGYFCIWWVANNRNFDTNEPPFRLGGSNSFRGFTFLP